MKNKRNLCLAYIVKNYNQWPAPETNPNYVSHHGYSWRKLAADGPWVLKNSEHDTIFEAAFTHAYFDLLEMSDHFTPPEEPKLSGDPDDKVVLTFTVAQARAMFYAVSRYDGMKAKLAHARAITEKLNKELGGHDV